MASLEGSDSVEEEGNLRKKEKKRKRRQRKGKGREVFLPSFYFSAFDGRLWNMASDVAFIVHSINVFISSDTKGKTELNARTCLR